MKKLFTLLSVTVIAFTTASQAQLRLGIMGGPQSASVIEQNSLPDWESSTKPNYTSRSGLHIGFIAEIPLGQSNQFFLQPAILYTAKGRKFAQVFDTAAVATDTLSYSSTFYANYIEVPLNLTYKLRMGKKSSFLVSAGPYVAFFYNGKRTAESRLVMSDNTVKFKSNEETLEAGNDVNKIKTVDFGVNGRAGFEFGNVMLTGFFSQGLSNFYSAPYDGTFKHRVIGASLGFWLSSQPVERKLKDRDHDGVPDKSDACPDIAGPAITGGCPDSDGDGIADNVDKCPKVPGLAKYRGCPLADRDNDGIPDDQDQCPDVAGTAKYKGCPVPDTDGDGLNDETDACPDKAGPVEFNGCPIPDSDGDGVNDKEDKCPNVAGTKENNGCPAIQKEIIEKVNYVARNIFFALGSDQLKPASRKALDEVAAILLKDTSLKLSIHGYSDNTGSRALNLELSQKRTESVKNYLVQKGIAANRLTATGFGPENPIADNSTEAGRARNRRVEMKLANQ